MVAEQSSEREEETATKGEEEGKRLMTLFFILNEDKQGGSRTSIASFL